VGQFMGPCITSNFTLKDGVTRDGALMARRAGPVDRLDRRVNVAGTAPVQNQRCTAARFGRHPGWAYCRRPTYAWPLHFLSSRHWSARTWGWGRSPAGTSQLRCSGLANLMSRSHFFYGIKVPHQQQVLLQDPW